MLLVLEERKFQVAWWLLRKLQFSGLQANENERRSRTRSRAFHYGAILGALGERDWEKALSLIGLAEAEEAPLDVIGYNAGASACNRASSWRQSLKLLSRLCSLCS